MTGVVHGGQQPISGSQVYLFAAATNGYGAASTSLLGTVAGGKPTSVDANGNRYTTSDQNGNFALSDYTCAAASQVYVYATGGDAGAGSNAFIGLLAALGQCPTSGTFIGAIPLIVINEVTTVAAAYALAGFANDGMHIGSSGSPLALIDISNAFLTAANLADITGATNASGARSKTIAGNGIVSQAIVNTLADIAAACINSSAGSFACIGFFANARVNGNAGPYPVDTAEALINVAHNPNRTAAALWKLVGSVAPFYPTLALAPNDWDISISYTDSANSYRLVIDEQGNIWTGGTFGSANIVKRNNQGARLLQLPVGGDFDIDIFGNAWVLPYPVGREPASNVILAYSPSGGALNGTGFPTVGYPSYIRLDASGSPVVLSALSSGMTSTQYLQRISTTGVELGRFSIGNELPVQDMAVDSYGNTYLPSSSTAVQNQCSYYVVNNTQTAVKQVNCGSSSLTIGVAIDSVDSPWIADDSSAAIYNPSTGDIADPVGGPFFLTIDGANQKWVTHIPTSQITSTLVSVFRHDGTVDGIGTTLPDPIQASTDGSGNVWVVSTGAAPSGAYLTELIGAGVPTVTPSEAALMHRTSDPRP